MCVDASVGELHGIWAGCRRFDTGPQLRSVPATTGRGASPEPLGPRS
jgi:hypothetical protein